MKIGKFKKEVFDEIKRKGLICILDMRDNEIKIVIDNNTHIYKIKKVVNYLTNKIHDDDHLHYFFPKYFDSKKKELRGYIGMKDISNVVSVKV